MLTEIPGSVYRFNWIFQIGRPINLLKTIKPPNFECPCGGHDDFADLLKIGPT